MSGTVHVVGAGLAGLSAAVRLAEGGRRVVLHEAAKAAGGRCRSYHDATLGLDIDNGNHLLLSGNREALDFVDTIGGRDALHEAADARFDFVDLRSGERWAVRPNAGRMPWWILVPSRRVPGTRLREYLAPLRLLDAPVERTIGSLMRCDGPLYERLWEPVLLAALNTEVPACSAGLAAPVLRETLAAGGDACRPIVATGGLSAAFVDPALAFLDARAGSIRYGARLRGLERENGEVRTLAFSDGTVELGPDDGVVLAVPAPVAGDLLPGLPVPTEFRSIVNAHFALAPPTDLPQVMGLVGGTAEWLFAYPDRLSVTISGADRLLDRPREELAELIWRDVATAARLGAPPLPPWQIVKEKRATFAATPEQARSRPAAEAAGGNLVLAGDWTDTGLPATIEGAIRSGITAASVLLGRNGGGARGVSKGWA